MVMAGSSLGRPDRMPLLTAGVGMEWVGEWSGAECLLPAVPQTLHPARGWLFPQSVLSSLVQLRALCVGAGAGRGALMNTCKEIGALTLLW